jgi:hypothetical protein
VSSNPNSHTGTATDSMVLALRRRRKTGQEYLDASPSIQHQSISQTQYELNYTDAAYSPDIQMSLENPPNNELSTRNRRSSIKKTAGRRLSEENSNEINNQSAGNNSPGTYTRTQLSKMSLNSDTIDLNDSNTNSCVAHRTRAAYKS